MANNDPPHPDRRDFLKQVATLAGSAPLAPNMMTSASVAVAAALGIERPAASTGHGRSAPTAVAGYLSLSPNETAFVETMVNVMCPADDLTPNGVDCGLATFIDRQLAGGFGQGERRYMRGPWKTGKPELGPQLPLTPEQFFKAGVAAASDACAIQHGKAFEQLTAADADAFLHQLQSGAVADARVPLQTWFNDLVYPLFVQACFADPIYGGNADKVFWKMLGYPGLPATHTLDMVRFRGKQYPGGNNPKSIADFS